ncbi:MAG: hypothetical protein Q9182_003595 [Xanthomendoza sp. 2 TL-2023]
MNHQQNTPQTHDWVANVLFDTIQDPHVNPRPIVKLPPMPAKASNHSRHISDGRSERDQGEKETHSNFPPRGGPFKSIISAGNLPEGFKRLTASPLDRQQVAQSEILYDAFGDPINYTKSSAISTPNSHVLESYNNEFQKQYDPTPQSTPLEMPTAAVSSRTAALLLEGARSNWENICEALMVGIGPDDKKILGQIAILIRRLGTESGPLSLAHQPHFANFEMTSATNLGTAMTCMRQSKAGAISTVTKDIATQVLNEEDLAVGEDEEDEEELQARRERIGLSLMMRRQEQPFRK